MSSLINILSSQSFKIFNIWGPLKLREETFPSCRGRQSPNLRKSLSCFIEDFRYLACFTCWIYDAEESCELGVSYFLQQIMFLWSSSWGSSIFSALWHSYCQSFRSIYLKTCFFYREFYNTKNSSENKDRLSWPPKFAAFRKKSFVK